MSHVTVVKVSIDDLDSLKSACKTLNLEFRENQRTYKWYGRSVGDYPIPEGFTKEELGTCDHAIGVPGNDKAYEIGVKKKGDEYKLVWDFWNGGYGLQDMVGNDCNKLIGEYTKEKACKKITSFAKANGWTVNNTQQGDETVYTLRKY